MKQILILCLGFSIVSCKTYNDENKNDFDKQIKVFLNKKQDKYIRSESGLYYSVIESGQGNDILPTDEVTFTYVGKLLNGNVFDSKHKKEAITFRVKKLILAWQEAMFYIKKGGKIKLIVPPQLGYGDNEIERIPTNSILSFELQVIDVK